MSAKILHPGRLFLYLALSVLDLCLTYRLLHVGGGHIYESNPIANAWLNRYGWLGLTGFKVASMILVASATVVVSLRHPRAGGGILTFACSAVAIVVLYSFSLVNYFGKGLAPGATFSVVAELGRSAPEAPYANYNTAATVTQRRLTKPNLNGRPPAPGAKPSSVWVNGQVRINGRRLRPSPEPARAVEQNPPDASAGGPATRDVKLAK
jgi:hypothetical protein